MKWTVLLGALAAGCGGTSGGGKGDMAKPAPADMAMMAGPDLALPPVELPGKKVAEGNYHLVAVTDDEHAVYQVAPKDTGAYVVPFGGGNPTTVAADATRLAVRGKLVFVFNNHQEITTPSGLNAGHADLLVWSAAKGVKPLAQKSFLIAGNNTFYRLATTEDGAYVMYSANTNADANASELWIAKSDGTGATKVFSNVAFDENCAPVMFAAGQYFLVSPCMGGAMKNDAGVVARDAYAVNVTKPAMPILLKKGARPAAADKAGTKVVVVDDLGNAELYPIGGGMPTAKLAPNYDYALFTPDGKDLVIHGNEGGQPDLDVLGTVRRQTPGMNPITVVDTKDVADIRELTPDYKYMIFTKVWSDNRFHSDLFLAPTDKKGTVVTLSKTDDGAIFGDAFTASGSHALYYTAATADGIGIFWTLPVAGGTPKEWGKKVWLSWNVGKGTVVTFNDNFKKGTGNPPKFLRADIAFVDVAKNEAPVVTVPQAHADYFMNKARTKYVYTYDVNPDQTGIWVADVPAM